MMLVSDEKDFIEEALKRSKEVDFLLKKGGKAKKDMRGHSLKLREMRKRGVC